VTATTSPAVADFWFDPICPWAWMASRWMQEVTRVREVTVRWHVMSLAALNEGRDLDPGYRELMDRAWGPARVVVAIESDHGEAAVKSFYDAIGTILHPGGERDYDVAIKAALAQTGLPAQLADRAHSDAADGQLRAANAEVSALVGDDVGTPVIALAGTAFFGPVVTPAPKGEAAGRLWDGCLLVAGTPGFFEIKRSRTQGPVFD
jgi:hypothetical protein